MIAPKSDAYLLRSIDDGNKNALRGEHKKFDLTLCSQSSGALRCV